MMPLFISHYTVDTPYEKEVKNLVASLDKFKLDYEIEGINSLGTWRANSNYCALQVQKMLNKHPDKSVLRVDADAVVQRTPDLFLQPNFNPDIAAVIWKESKLRPKGELLGGTMYFANTEITRQIVNEWVQQCGENPRARNSDLLQNIIRQTGSNLRFENLPLSYCTIFDSMRSQVNKPVIEHFQASRRFKSTINQVFSDKDKPVDVSHLYQYKKSSVCIFLGSGRSIKDIGKKQWKILNRFDVWTVNNWVYHPFIVPNFYHIEAKHYNYHLLKRRIEGKQNAYKNVKFIFPRGKSIGVNKVRHLLYRIVPFESFKFDYKSNSRDIRRTHEEFNSDYSFNPICLTKSYDMSLTAIFELLFKFGYKKIITFGVDLSDSFYFWSDGEPEYGETHHKTNKEHEGKDPNHPHSTHRIKDFIIDFNQRWMKPSEGEILVGHKDTMLFPDLNYISPGELKNEAVR